MTADSVPGVTPTDDTWIPGCLHPAADLTARHGGRYICGVIIDGVVDLA